MLNPPAQKVYITNNKAITITNLVEMFDTTEKVWVYQCNKVSSVIIFRLEISAKHQPSTLDGTVITIDIWLNPDKYINNVEKFERQLMIKD